MSHTKNHFIYSEILSLALAAGFMASAWPFGLSPLSPFMLTSLQTNWQQEFGRDLSLQNRYNQQIKTALREWDALDPWILKSLLIQESGMQPKKINHHGYAGIAQIGHREARHAGIKRGERLQPDKAIQACAHILRHKSENLEQKIFSRYGTPTGDEYWKFIAASYNAGEGTISKAARLAYGKNKPRKIMFNDLITSPTGSWQDTPLAKALPRWWHKKAKLKEISEFAINIVNRARQ